MKIRIRGLSSAIVISASLVLAGQYHNSTNSNNSNGHGRGLAQANGHSHLLTSNTNGGHHPRGNETAPSTSAAPAMSPSPHVDDDGN